MMGQQATDQIATGQIVQVGLAQLPWYHHIALLDKLKTPQERLWYADAQVKHPDDQPTIGILLCKSKILWWRSMHSGIATNRSVWLNTNWCSPFPIASKLTSLALRKLRLNCLATLLTKRRGNHEKKREVGIEK